MNSEILQKARSFEEQYVSRVPAQDRPAFHVTGGIGWINDPNGFSCYRGEYHLFFQYHPYSTLWGPMHWGHVKTKDFIRWERLPVAMAPDTDADPDGCFSGSAIELPDGRQLLFYTGVRRVRQGDGALLEYQSQCVAVGDGVNYEKLAENPVLSGEDVPEGGSDRDFRDPKLWREEDGTYCAVIGNRCADGSGAILLYQSEDAVHWRFVTVLDSSKNEYGRMWECPDFFPLDGKQVLMVSPQEMHPKGLEFHAGYGTVCFVGSYEKASHRFSREHAQAIDYGIDFYAPQTLEAYDGRRIMIAWMQNWTTATSQPQDVHCFGEMTLPRELHVRDGRLIQNPVRELEQYRRDPVRYTALPVVDGETEVPGIHGRFLDLTVSIRPGRGGYQRFAIQLAVDEEHHTTIRYRPGTGTVRVDRSHCGFPHDIVHVREFPVRYRNGELKIRVILDRYSAELFFNDGEQAATFVLYTDVKADAIRFSAEGEVEMDVEQYNLIIGNDGETASSTERQ